MPVMPAARSQVDGIGGLCVGLHPVDRLLHDRIEALHAKAGAVDAAFCQHVDHLAGQRARVDLDGKLGFGE